MSSGISQSLTSCLSHNMQRRAFIIFIKTIFLRFLCDDPVSTPHSLWIEFRIGDKRNSNHPYLSCFIVRHTSETQVSVSLVLDPHQNILAEPQAIWKMIHLTSQELRFLYFCLKAMLVLLQGKRPSSDTRNNNGTI